MAHGLVERAWGFMSMITAMLHRWPGSDLFVSSWSVGLQDIQKLVTYRDEGLCRRIQFMVDPSFVKRHPQRARELGALLGDGSVIERNSHAKFVLLLGGDQNVAYSTSMNINQDARVDAGTLILDEGLVAEYVSLLNGVFDLGLDGCTHEGLGAEALADLGISRGFVDHVSTGWDFGDMIVALRDKLCLLYTSPSPRDS